MNNYPCIEKTIEVSFENKTVRLWIDITNEENLKDINELTIVKNIEEMLDTERRVIESVIFETLIETIPHLNAIQVITTNGGVKTGKVIYTTAFQDDVHG